jgi:hypothetical protein
LVVSAAAACVSGFSAYQSYRSATAAVAGTRPLIEIEVQSPIEVKEILHIPVTLRNSGKTRAAIQSLRLVTFEQPSNQVGVDPTYHYHDFPDVKSMILRPGDSPATFEIDVSRYQTINGVSVDLAKGMGNHRRLRFKIEYLGLELNRESFSDDIAAAVTWKE